MVKTIPELLAPAGGMKQLTAAVENGADAVYLGGSIFNARINADNFTEDEIKQGIQYAHLRNVKVYITLNILLKDEELLPALEYAYRLYKMGADGLILQDLGLASLIKQYIPHLPIHLSTQGSVYNLSGVKKAKKLGFSRVVLARELTLDEIRTVTSENVCDIEVFVHGALCMCYSGQCQMSRALGGGNRSGNRGLCAQPCRLLYKPEGQKASYILSPKDLWGIDHLGKLAEAGVASLKIEGRMKSPEYVAAAVGIYRKYLDLYADCGTYQVSDEDRNILMQIFNRGNFTCGYFNGNPGTKLLSGTLPKHQGVFAGKVVKDVPGTHLIDIKPAVKLEMGDGIEIRSSKLIGNVVTYMEQRKGGILRIGDIKGKAAPGDGIYRITDSRLMKQLRQTFEEGGPEGKKHKRTVPVEMELEVKIGKQPLLAIQEGNCRVQVFHKEEAQRALKKPLTKEAAEKQLKKTGGTPFRAEKIDLDIEDGAVVPVSALNQLRRQGLDKLALEKMKTERKSFPLPEKLPDVNRKAEIKENCLAFYFFSTQQFEGWDFAAPAADTGLPVRAYVPLGFYMKEKLRRQDVEIIPYILNISKGRLDQYIEEHFDEIVREVRRCGIAIGNLAWIDEFTEAGVKVYGDYGLNCFNQYAQELVSSWNTEVIAASHEACQDKESGIPLMITEHEIGAEIFSDRKKQEYKIVYNYEKDKNLIFKKTKKYNFEQGIQFWGKQGGERRIYIP